MELKPITPEDQNEIYRFIHDLEFVQSLSSPLYLHFLAKSNYFDDEEFLNYLKYLSYFNKFEYKKYITYTRSLIIDVINYASIELIIYTVILRSYSNRQIF